MATPGPFHVTGLGIPETWQPQISYTQLQAPKTSVPGGSQMAAVALVLTHLGGRTPSLLSHAITSLARHHFSRTLLVRGKSRQPAHSQGYKLHSTSGQEKCQRTCRCVSKTPQGFPAYPFLLHLRPPSLERQEPCPEAPSLASADLELSPAAGALASLLGSDLTSPSGPPSTLQPGLLASGNCVLAEPSPSIDNVQTTGERGGSVSKQ